jgi:hypothetical protein
VDDAAILNDINVQENNKKLKTINFDAFQPYYSLA